MSPSTRIGDVVLSFSAMNAAGAWSTTVEELVALAKSRAGAVVVRSTTLHPFLHPEFRSLHNPGYDRYVPLLTELAAYRKPLVASIAGSSVEEYVTLARAFAEAGAHLIEVNLAEPYVVATLCPWDDQGELVRLLVAVRAAATRPILVKCPERIPLPLGALRGLLCDAGVEGVVLANTFAVMEKFLLAPGPGPVVVALGGVRSGYDLATALRKGAGAVQVSTALAVEGPSVFARLAREHAALVGG